MATPPSTAPAPYVAVGLIAVAIAILAYAAQAGWLRSVDEGLLLSMRADGTPPAPLGPLGFQEAIRDISALGSNVVLTFAVAVIAGFLWIVGAPRHAAFLVIAVALGTALNRLLKLAIGRPRPDIVEHGTYVSSLSFPSGHAANSAIVYLVLGMLLARVEATKPAKTYVFAVCVFMAGMIGLSRIYLGVHWPSDVFAGWLLGAGWTLLCWHVLTRTPHVEGPRF